MSGQGWRRLSGAFKQAEVNLRSDSQRFKGRRLSTRTAKEGSGNHDAAIGQHEVALPRTPTGTEDLTRAFSRIE